MPTVIAERLAKIEGLPLLDGAHDENAELEMCVMEAVAYVAGERWSDRPSCASPVLSAYARSLNDRLKHEDRQRLKPYVAKLVGTVGSRDLEERRAMLAVDHVIRVAAPDWLDAAGEHAHASALRSLPEIKTREDVARAALAEAQRESKRLVWEAELTTKAFERARLGAMKRAQNEQRANVFASERASRDSYNVAHHDFWASLREAPPEVQQAVRAEYDERVFT